MSLVEGPVARVLAVSTAPLAAALVIMFGVQLAEAWLVGRLGPAALAALGFALPLVMTAMSFGIGLGAGASAVIGRAIGAREEGVAHLSGHVLLLAAGLAVIVAVPAWLAAPALVRAIGAEGEAASLALSYLRIWLPGLLPLLVGMAALSLLRAAGDTRFQGAALAGAGVLAFALDWPLAFGVPGLLPGLGLAGVALAAALSWCAMLAVAIPRLRHLGLIGGRRGAGPGLAEATRRVLRVGVPAAATNAIIPLAAALFTALIARHGEAAVAGFALGTRAEALAMTVLFALSAVANPFAAQNAGAGRLERVQAGLRAALTFCAGYGALVALPLCLAAPVLARWLAAGPEVAESAALYLQIMPWGFGAVGAIAVVNAALNGLERPMSAVAVSLARTFLLGVPLAWLGSRLGGEVGTLAGILAANLLVGIGAAAWVLRRTGRGGVGATGATRLAVG
ncbi:MATE family efflux transporter [Roseomonas sp. CCTCC AB2023176]|uniref:MATE family efflux transporter n=1 Tax=Roseomonas sp. CCTCC AB2023176 TaxID=3342640 RepID=UPI0035E37DD3